MTLAELNTMDCGSFTAAVGWIYEHSPWIAEQASSRAPFASVAALHEAMLDVVAAAPADRKLALLQAHPELAAATSTPESTAEQRAAGLTHLSGEPAARLEARNAVYRARFGFPFIIAVRGTRDVGAILHALEARLANTRQQEIAEALHQVGQIAGFRLHDLIAEGRVTTHVLDTASGKPAAGLAFTLDRMDDAGRVALGRITTNADGRCDAPLLGPADMAQGEYEVVFNVADWWQANGLDPGFYDRIPIRFRITDEGAHYHVPLILAPYGYATYRGS
jgi:2-oxo-4-hydroxy-4-carboxy-5-ureidoimidazoline decarboxylase